RLPSTKRRQPPSQPSRLTVVPAVGSQPKIRDLSAFRKVPLWLKALIWVQRSSMVMTSALVVSSFAVYAWTFYSQQLWHREHSKLESLHRNERQLISASEALKHHMAAQAKSPGADLEQVKPNHMIFLKPAPQRAAQTYETSDLERLRTDPNFADSLGY
ncbi:MAG: hypothetical protein F6K19_47980, partial [Cyanothece sp. SIO1E1]|nr:hypothetical protein [Cyanothece sp. SIO1E1]